MFLDFLIVICLLNTFPNIGALKCYVCNSRNQPECDESHMPNRTTAMDAQFMKECATGVLYCMKTTQFIYLKGGVNISEVRYIRECADNWTWPSNPLASNNSSGIALLVHNITTNNWSTTIIPNTLITPLYPVQMTGNTILCEKHSTIANFMSTICYCKGDGCNANITLIYVSPIAPSNPSSTTAATKRNGASANLLTNGSFKTLIAILIMLKLCT
ncbi:unnamed protein product [Gordionus sp. m RMFG-2023]|uniref:uncharacterized protein LOC135925174 n=1 Tax=Gordionus sp. m RMFG-2023 TaxID=3053472 RepID=UPI0030E4A5BE